MHICDFEKCSGCGACMNICPHNAIIMRENEYGEIVPFVLEDRCTLCGLCQKTCPVNNEVDKRKAEVSYAVLSKDSNDAKYSSSGGVAAVFSRYVLQNGGVVYGAACTDKKTKHIRVDDESGIDKLRGSKYVQSEIGLIYRDVKEKLKADKKVLFIGTPCQVAGLKAFLKKDWDNLITVDLICHGTPPHKFLQEHLDRKIKSWDSYSFRGLYDFCLSAYRKNELVFCKECNQDEYYKSFLDGLTYRNSCYSCQFARPQRVSDITIGDFWGLDKKTLKNHYPGRISVLLPNTSKGREFFFAIKDLFIFEERKFEEAANEEQGNLLHPSNKHPEREKFLNNYVLSGFDNAVKKTDAWKKNIRKQRIIKIKRTPLYKGLAKFKNKFL